MTDVLLVIVAMAYGYLVGSVPTAYLVARWTRGLDLRRYGSGNIGGANVFRNVGKGSFALVAAFDVLAKGTGTVGLAWALGLDLKFQALAALMALIGHNWSLYLRFSGGRGLSVAAGSLLILAWKGLLVSLSVALVGWLLSKKDAGLGFGIALVLLPVWALVTGEPVTIVLFCTAILAASILKRLLPNPGTALPGFRWRDVAIWRLLYDRDTPRSGDWIWRKPEDTHTRGEE